MPRSPQRRRSREMRRSSCWPSAEQRRPSRRTASPQNLHAAARTLERWSADGAALIDQPQGGDEVAWLRLPYPQTWGPNAPRGEPSRQQRRGNSASSPANEKPDRQHANNSATEANSGAQAEAPVLHRAPVRVGSLLQPLYAPNSGLVLAAPTMAVAGDFTFVRGGLGLPERQRRTRQPSIAASRPCSASLLTRQSPTRNSISDASMRRSINLGTTLNGRMVVILPSHTGLRAAAMGIRRALERRDILVLAQGVDGSARQLWRTFRSEPRVVLLGAGAFWEGADQAEQPPACVVVTRVPFPALTAIRCWPRAPRRGATPRPNSSCRTPRSACVRHSAASPGSHWRRNAIVLFDRRLQTRSYGPTILGTLPRCTQYQETMETFSSNVRRPGSIDNSALGGGRETVPQT